MMNRNLRRMHEYNMRKYNEALAKNQADEKETPEMRASGRARKPTARSQNYKRDGKPPLKPMLISDPAEVTPQAVKASKEVLKVEPLWEEGPYTGTQPVQHI
ncbi:uncharacterized protein LOC143216755 isoform X2 [Lasioglossum baleicum]